MIDLLRENEAASQENWFGKTLLVEASQHLRILDPVFGEQELVKLVAVELANWKPEQGTDGWHNSAACSTGVPRS